MQIWLLVSFLLACSSLGLFGQSPPPFALADIADEFPSRGFEVEINFWKRMFTVYTETQVVFHDRGDLRILYEIVEFEEGIRGNEEEAERQGKILKKRKEDFRRLLLDLSRREPRSGPERAVDSILKDLGHETSSSLYRRLARDLRYQRGLREQFAEGISRSGQYLEAIDEILKKEGVPGELAVLPHIESAFQWSAVSKSGAVGLWQFVRGTARSYMTVNRYVDQRLDPLESTRAAARLLRDNYQALGSWPLAITAYNYGRSGMLRAKKRLGSDMLTIARRHKSRSFGFASRNFYPEFLAAVEIVRNVRLYFGDLRLRQPLEYSVLVLPASYPLAVFERVDGLDRKTLRAYNPYLTARVWKEGVLPAGISLRLPVPAREPLAEALEKARPATSRFEVSPDGNAVYRVRSGDTVGRIAAHFGTSIGAIGRANSLADPNRIVPGQQLRIPGSGTSVGPVHYRVRSGDTLEQIARRFQTSLHELVRANSLSNPNRIFLGQVLLIP